MHEGEALKSYIQDKNIDVTDLANKLGLNRTSIYVHFKQERLKSTLKEKYSKVLGVDFLSYKQDTNKTTPKLEAVPLRLADPMGYDATGQKFYTLPDGSEVMQITVVPQKAWGSYPMGHADPEFYDGFETITVPVHRLHRGTYLAFEMKGRSMVNIETEEMARKSLWPGQKIIGRDLKREQWQYKLHIHSNEAWIIVHRTDGIMVKEIIDHDLETGLLKLHSWNPDKKEYPDFTIHIDDVEQLFNVVDPFGKMRPY
ncbi:helix-turn-helix transcriptional regulator [Pedobacter sp. SYSU D00535]|uniref:LexA family transcriptional regulator n=1 Tax=Pedobacter sp. SYSU D00535 TaxID=2810308 RepID=UPI001A96B505|nr:helix-turn-helix transcriptional regulator [Pedobacter sp. SYSU D00535]